MRNFNVAPVNTAEQSSSWDYGDPTSEEMYQAPNTPDQWNMPQHQTWEAPSTSTYNTYTTTGFSEDWIASQAPEWGSTGVEEQFTHTERLRNVKDAIVHGMGRKALDAVMNRLPRFSGKDNLQTHATNLYENPALRQNVTEGLSDIQANFGGHVESAKQFGMNAGREVVSAGKDAAKEAVMRYYGLEKDENERLRVARKIKFGKAVVKTVVNPVGTATSVGVRAGRAARKSAKSEGLSQLRNARTAAIDQFSSYSAQSAKSVDTWDDWGAPRAA